METLLLQALLKYGPILVGQVIIPEVIRVTKGNPTLDDAGIIALLPEHVKALCSTNQDFLNSIRTAAGQ